MERCSHMNSSEFFRVQQKQYSIKITFEHIDKFPQLSRDYLIGAASAIKRSMFAHSISHPKAEVVSEFYNHYMFIISHSIYIYIAFYYMYLALSLLLSFTISTGVCVYLSIYRYMLRVEMIWYAHTYQNNNKMCI